MNHQGNGILAGARLVGDGGRQATAKEVRADDVSFLKERAGSHGIDAGAGHEIATDGGAGYIVEKEVLVAWPEDGDALLDVGGEAYIQRGAAKSQVREDPVLAVIAGNGRAQLGIEGRPCLERQAEGRHAADTIARR